MRLVYSKSGLGKKNASEIGKRKPVGAEASRTYLQIRSSITSSSSWATIGLVGQRLYLHNGGCRAYQFVSAKGEDVLKSGLLCFAEADMTAEIMVQDHNHMPSFVWTVGVLEGYLVSEGEHSHMQPILTVA
jgi:hypothetical protein